MPFVLQLLPQVPHGWLIQEVTQELVDQAKACGFNMLCPRANALTPEVVQLIKSQGLVVRAWGVKTIEVGKPGDNQHGQGQLHGKLQVDRRLSRLLDLLLLATMLRGRML